MNHIFEFLGSQDCRMGMNHLDELSLVVLLQTPKLCNTSYRNMGNC